MLTHPSPPAVLNVRSHPVRTDAPARAHLVAVDALVRPLPGVHAHVFVEAGRLGEAFRANRALQGTTTKQVSDQSEWGLRRSEARVFLHHECGTQLHLADAFIHSDS